MIFLPEGSVINSCWYPGCKKQPRIYKNKKNKFSVHCYGRGHQFTGNSFDTIEEAIDWWNKYADEQRKNRPHKPKARSDMLFRGAI